MNYILDENGNPKPEPNTIKWAQWFESANRHVAKTKVGPFLVSTVFLGLDHRLDGRGGPILWETMIFSEDSYDDEYQERYSSLEAALEGHKRAIEHAYSMRRENSEIG